MIAVPTVCETGPVKSAAARRAGHAIRIDVREVAARGATRAAVRRIAREIDAGIATARGARGTGRVGCVGRERIGLGAIARGIEHVLDRDHVGGRIHGNHLVDEHVETESVVRQRAIGRDGHVEGIERGYVESIRRRSRIVRGARCGRRTVTTAGGRDEEAEDEGDETLGLEHGPLPREVTSAPGAVVIGMGEGEDSVRRSDRVARSPSTTNAPSEGRVFGDVNFP